MQSRFLRFARGVQIVGGLFIMVACAATGNPLLSAVGAVHLVVGVVG